MMSGNQQQQSSSAVASAASEQEQQQQAELARKHAAAVATSRQWSAQTESRIVRVSRVFGGKDRHSKVKTVKGLRDRRVRLSVPTAIQLYDLQDRLGLNQPSKVVDWLLNAARHEIDKLPPLQFPPHHGQQLNGADLMEHHMASASMLPLMPHDFASALAADHGGKGHAHDDVADMGRFAAAGYHRFMGSNSSPLGLVNGGMPYNFTGESWNNNSTGGAHENCQGSPHGGQVSIAAAHHSAFPSLLSLAPRSHQLVYYASEAAEQFPVDNNLGSQGLSLSSARAFHDHDHAAGS